MTNPTRNRLGRPRFYLEERTEPTRLRNPNDHPVGLAGFDKAAAEGGWMSFIPPRESIEIHLLVPRGGDPNEAMREWCVRTRVQKLSRPRVFDARELLPIWNFGSSVPRAEIDADGHLRIETYAKVPWDHVDAAMRVWTDGGRRGPSPIDLMTALESPATIPRKNRWVSVSLDLSRPLDDQIRSAKELLRVAQSYARMLTGRRPAPRVKRELRRDILIYMLKYSGRRRIREISSVLFPGESIDSAERKVKDILRDMRARLKEVGLKPTP